MTKNSAAKNGPQPLAAHFSKFAQKTAQWTGHPTAFLLAVAIVLIWIVTGPLFGYSDTWQLVINTGTTELKLSELVLAMKNAENKFASIEDLSDDELENLHKECRADIMQKHTEKRHGKHNRPAAAHKAKTENIRKQVLKGKNRKKPRKAA